MASVRYTNAHGRVIAEQHGASRRFLKCDPQGNVLGLYDNNQTLTDSFTYWPYGEVRTQTNPFGTKLKFSGGLGCRTTLDGRIYMRARTLQPKYGRWLTVDPLWPDEASFVFAQCSPMSKIDPSGTQAGKGGEAGLILRAFICCEEQSSKALREAAKFCRHHGIGDDANGNNICNAYQHCLWACLFAQNCGNSAIGGNQIALDCTNMHEDDSPSWCPWELQGYRRNLGKPNPADQKCIDLYNNRVGINCASAASCQACCRLNAKAGNLQIIDLIGGLPRGWRKGKTDCKRNPSRVILPPIDMT